MSRRSRDFNGCWTCRARKVKCDLQKPVCQRCIKAGKHCDGFDLKLGWADPLTLTTDNSLISLISTDTKSNNININGAGSETFQRRNVDLVKFPKSMQYETYRLLNKKLEEIEREVDQRVGPFGVYQLDGYDGVRKIRKIEFNGQNATRVVSPLQSAKVPLALAPISAVQSNQGSPKSSVSSNSGISRLLNSAEFLDSVEQQQNGIFKNSPVKTAPYSDAIRQKSVSYSATSSKPVTSNSARNSVDLRSAVNYSNPVAGAQTSNNRSLFDRDSPHEMSRRNLDQEPKKFKIEQGLVDTPKRSNVESTLLGKSISNLAPINSDNIVKGLATSQSPPAYSPMQSIASLITSPTESSAVSSPHRSNHPNSIANLINQQGQESTSYSTKVVLDTNKNQSYSETKAFNINSKSLLTNDSWVHSELLDYAKLTLLAVNGRKFEFNEQNMLHALYPKFFPSIEADDWEADIKVLDQLFLYDTETQELRLKPLFRELMNNFTSEIFSFNRVHFDINYFDTLVIPCINSIVTEFLCYDFAQEVSTLHTEKVDDDDDNEEQNESMDIPHRIRQLKQNLKLGVFYLVLGLSSFKKSHRKHVNDKNTYYLDQDLKMAIELRKLSITIVNFHLDEFDKHDELLNGCPTERESFEYETFLLLALILQIEFDNCFSVFENLDLIYAIGDHVIKHKFKPRLSNLTKFLVNVFRISYTLFESTQSINLFNYKISDGDARANYRDLDENFDLAKENEDDEEEEEEDNSMLQIKSSFKNVIVSNSDKGDHTKDYSPLSFTLTYNKSDMTGYNRAEEVVPMTDRKDSISKEPFCPKDNFTSVIDPNNVYLMYGIPKSLIQIFHEVIHLTNHKNIFTARKVFPRKFPGICAKAQDELINWRIEDDWVLDIENDDMHRCLSYNITAFHSAIIVYYSRLVNTLPKEQVEHHISNALENFERLINEGSPRFRPSFWILLVCGSEVRDKEQQQKIERLWLASDERSSNHWRSKQILYEIWKRSEVNEENGFMDMIREWDIILCLG